MFGSARAVETHEPAGESWRCSACGRFALPTKRCHDPNVPNAVCSTCYALSQASTSVVRPNDTEGGSLDQEKSQLPLSQGLHLERSYGAAEGNGSTVDVDNDGFQNVDVTKSVQTARTVAGYDATVVTKTTASYSVMMPAEAEFSVGQSTLSDGSDPKSFPVHQQTAFKVEEPSQNAAKIPTTDYVVSINVNNAERNIRPVYGRKKATSSVLDTERASGSKASRIVHPRDAVREQAQAQNSKASDFNSMDFPPGSLVWAGGRGYAGGVWDPWPGRVVDPEAINSREFRNIRAKKRAVMLFNHDRKFVLMNITALRMYVPYPQNKKTRFRDSRGHFACALADKCAELYPSSFSGIVDEEAIRSMLSHKILEECHELEGYPHHRNRHQSAAPLTVENMVSPSVSAAAGSRRRRSAAARNPFCAASDSLELPAKRVYTCAHEATAPAELQQQSEDIEALVSKPTDFQSREEDSTAVAVDTNTRDHKRIRRAESHRDVQSSQVDSGCHGRGSSQRPVGMPWYEKLPETTAEGATYLLRAHADHAERSEGVISLAVLGVEHVADVMTQFVCQGLPNDTRLAVKRIILSGCMKYALNGRALLARRPSAEELASIVLGDREPRGEDGVYWSLVEFIHLAREQKMDLSGLEVRL